MSLITDALKRAQNTTDQQPGQTPPPVTSPPLPNNQYADVPQERNERSRTGLLVVLVLIVIVVAAGGMWAYGWLSRKAPREQTVIPVAAKAAHEPASETAETAKPATSTAAKPPVPAPKPVEVPRALENAKTQQTETQPPVPTPSLEPPKLTLQGVMTEGQDREAVINGVSLHVGDNIEGARVTAIDARSVRLQFGDRDIQLRLP
jgi:flagellar basal body-associated protein FliL